MTDSQIVAALRRAFSGEDLQAIGYGRHPDSIARCGAAVRTLDVLLNHHVTPIAPSREAAPVMSLTPDERVTAILVAVYDMVDPYDRPKTELLDLARTIRDGGIRLAADPAIVTAEAFDRVATMLETIARAI